MYRRLALCIAGPLVISGLFYVWPARLMYRRTVKQRVGYKYCRPTQVLPAAVLVERQ